MKRRRAQWSLMVLLVGIFALWWGVSVLSGQNYTFKNSSAAKLVSYTSNTPIIVYGSMLGNTHTFEGSVPLANSCEVLGSGIAVQGSNPAHVTVVLSLMESPGLCAQAAGNSEEMFNVSLSLPTNTQVVFDGTTMNGVIVPSMLTSK